jgi:hypothetical protein
MPPVFQASFTKVMFYQGNRSAGMVRGVVTLGKRYEIIKISVLVISGVGTCRRDCIHLALDFSANKNLYRTVNLS